MVKTVGDDATRLILFGTFAKAVCSGNQGGKKRPEMDRLYLFRTAKQNQSDGNEAAFAKNEVTLGEVAYVSVFEFKES